MSPSLPAAPYVLLFLAFILFVADAFIETLLISYATGDSIKDIPDESVG